MVNDYLKKMRLFSRDARLYMATWVVLGFCWIGIYMVLFNLCLLRLGYDLEFVGLVNAPGHWSSPSFPARRCSRRTLGRSPYDGYRHEHECDGTRTATAG